MDKIVAPASLKPGDRVGIVCPAGALSTSIEPSIRLLESWGLRVQLGNTVKRKYYSFAGNDTERCRDLQKMLDDPELRAIFAARGGYGSVRIIDSLDFSSFLQSPKWVIGYSDITVLHVHINTLFGVPTLHGQMPSKFASATAASLSSLKKALFGEPVAYQYIHSGPCRTGSTEGLLIGGNLAILASMAGSDSDPDYNGKILFLEDVGEHHYTIDRMMRMLKRAGKLTNLKGLIAGGFTALKDKPSDFGASCQEIIMEVVDEFDYPVTMGFPAGHINNHKTLIFGKPISLEVDSVRTALNY